MAHVPAFDEKSPVLRKKGGAVAGGGWSAVYIDLLLSLREG